MCVCWMACEAAEGTELNDVDNTATYRQTRVEICKRNFQLSSLCQSQPERKDICRRPGLFRPPGKAECYRVSHVSQVRIRH